MAPSPHDTVTFFTAPPPVGVVTTKVNGADKPALGDDVGGVMVRPGAALTVTVTEPDCWPVVGVVGVVGVVPPVPPPVEPPLEPPVAPTVAVTTACWLVVSEVVAGPSQIGRDETLRE